ncbi:MAG: hypothetical protein WBW01_01740, partial [Terriglobales bacterium]
VGMAIEVDHHRRGEKLLKTAAYVRVWQPGETDHADSQEKRNFIRFSAPQLVRYFPREQHGHGSEVNVGWTDESGNKRQGYLARSYASSPVPALLCKDEAEAEDVFDWCASYRKCKYCGDPFVPTRKDQKCCDKKNHAVLYRMRKCARKKARFRPRTR